MAQVSTYVNQMKGAVTIVAAHLGYDATMADNAEKALVVGQLAVTATMAKVLVDKGLITETELQAAFQAAILETWPALPIT